MEIFLHGFSSRWGLFIFNRMFYLGGLLIDILQLATKTFYHLCHRDIGDAHYICSYLCNSFMFKLIQMNVLTHISGAI